MILRVLLTSSFKRCEHHYGQPYVYDLEKRLLFDGIDQLVDRAIALFEKALEFAYQKLESFERTKGPNEEGAGKGEIS